jgi:hypothetical protein
VKTKTTIAIATAILIVIPPTITAGSKKGAGASQSPPRQPEVQSHLWQRSSNITGASIDHLWSSAQRDH